MYILTHDDWMPLKLKESCPIVTTEDDVIQVLKEFWKGRGSVVNVKVNFEAQDVTMRLHSLVPSNAEYYLVPVHKV